jgi:hypothetical protein
MSNRNVDLPWDKASDNLQGARRAVVSTSASYVPANELHAVTVPLRRFAQLRSDSRGRGPRPAREGQG